jgi:hypothetical protein
MSASHHIDVGYRMRVIDAMKIRTTDDPVPVPVPMVRTVPAQRHAAACASRAMARSALPGLIAETIMVLPTRIESIAFS